MNKTKIIIFVTAGLWQLPGIKEAKKLGLKILGIDHDKNAIGLKYCDFMIVNDLDKHKLIINEIDNLNLQPLGSLSYCSEAGMKLSSILIDHYNLFGLKKKITKLLTNKNLQRKKLANTISQPKFFSSKKKSEIKNFIIKENKPLIIKPVDGSGSKGVIKIEEETKDLNKIINTSLNFSKTNQLIVEQFINGLELTVEMFFINGLAINLAITKKKKLSTSKNTVAYELATVDLKDKEKNKIFNFVKDAYHKLGYFNGPAHAEIIKKNRYLYVVELAGRGPGFDVFSKFLPLVSNINLSKLLILQSINKLKNLQIKKQNKHGIIKYYPSKKGKILKIINAKNVISEKIYYKKFVKEGQNTNYPKTDGDRNGYLMVIDNQYSICRKKIKKYYNKFKFIY
jgi:phosphoribosylamine-glycine ligase